MLALTQQPNNQQTTKYNSCKEHNLSTSIESSCVESPPSDNFSVRRRIFRSFFSRPLTTHILLYASTLRIKMYSSQSGNQIHIRNMQYLIWCTWVDCMCCFRTARRSLFRLDIGDWLKLSCSLFPSLFRAVYSCCCCYRCYCCRFYRCCCCCRCVPISFFFFCSFRSSSILEQCKIEWRIL